MIERIEATLLEVPVHVPVLDREVRRTLVLVELETEDGEVGHGVTSSGLNTAIVRFVNDEVAPYVLGRDPLRSEELAYDAYWTFNSRSLTGVWSSAYSAVDIALWDLKGKMLGQPVWRLLGGHADRVECYATFGLSSYDRDQLAEAARQRVSQGFDKLKMIVAARSHRERGVRSSHRDLVEDAARVGAVRDAVGADVELSMDANCLLDYGQALELARLCEPHGVSWFEEPIHQNDPSLLADLRASHSVRLSAGQNEGSRFKFRDFFVRHAVDLPQPNVANVGGFSEAIKVAATADSFNTRIGHAGGWGLHNAHLQAGVANGWLVEVHQLDADAIFDGVPPLRDGVLTLDDRPGLGFAPHPDAVAEYRST